MAEPEYFMPQFKVHGYGEKTGRKRKRTYHAYDEEEARKKAREDETEPETVERIPDEPATERQIEFARDLGVNIDGSYTKNEASDLISRTLEEDKPAEDRHKEFAAFYKVEYTQYANKKALFNKIYNQLTRSGNKEDICSWFLFRVYRNLVKGRYDVLIKGPWHPTIQQLAKEMAQDDSAYNSAIRYEGDELILFGELTTDDGWVISGGSTRTKAYAKAKELLTRELSDLQPKKKHEQPVTKIHIDASESPRGRSLGELARNLFSSPKRTALVLAALALVLLLLSKC